MKPKAFNFPKEVSDEMVRAILDGRKSVTRRVVKPQPISTSHVVFVRNDEAWFWWSGGTKKNQVKQPYRPGDILYVRETFSPFDYDHIIDGVKYAYKADITPEGDRARKEFGYKWHPSIHMPKEAARIFLRVTDVRVERLQNITIEDAIKEGCSGVPCDCANKFMAGGTLCCTDCMNTGWQESPAIEFWGLWDSAIKKPGLPHYGWVANPWVWVIEFERIGRDEALQHN